MRLDKLTTKFQEALGEAQTLALGNDNAYIEPVHLLVAMLRQEDGPTALLQRAGVNVPGLLAAAESAVHRLPKVEGQDQVQGSRDLGAILQAAEKEKARSTPCAAARASITRRPKASVRRSRSTAWT